MSSTLSRRSLVAAAPAAVVASLPALAATVLKAEETHPDAELMRLAVDFDRLHTEWQDLLDLIDELDPAWKERFASSGGSDDDFWRCGRESGYDDAVGLAAAKVREVDVVANQMRAIPAKTVQGLAIKARLTQFDVHLSRQSEMKASEADWDWDVRCMEHFVREMQRFANLAAMGGAHA